LTKAINTGWAPSPSKENKSIPNSKALRGLFAIKDGEVFDRKKFAKGLENLKAAYGTQGFINYAPIPTPSFDEQKKTVSWEVEIDEGKQFLRSPY